MTSAALRAQAHRCFLRFAPAVLDCDGDPVLERAVLAKPSMAAAKDLYDYCLTELRKNEQCTDPFTQEMTS